MPAPASKNRAPGNPGGDDTASAPEPAPRRMAAEARRALILDAAQRLFFARGYEAVTVADVLAEAGISKGGFYHHFTAKEDLLDGVVERATAETVAAATAARRAAPGNALARFNAFVAAANRGKADRPDQARFYADLLVRSGNDMLLQKVDAAISRAVRPVLREMIDEGVAEGCFDTVDPGLTAEVILSLGLGRRGLMQQSIRLADRGDLDQAAALLDRRMQAEGLMLDRLLGLAPGSVALSDPAENRRKLQAMSRG